MISPNPELILAQMTPKITRGSFRDNPTIMKLSTEKMMAEKIRNLFRKWSTVRGGEGVRCDGDDTPVERW